MVQILTSQKKSLVQEVRQKRDILERSTLFATRLCHCATCQGSSYTKNEYNLSYRKFDAEYFLFDNFFEKKLYFQRKPQKTVLGPHLTIFWGKKASYTKNEYSRFYQKFDAEYFFIR